MARMSQRKTVHNIADDILLMLGTIFAVDIMTILLAIGLAVFAAGLGLRMYLGRLPRIASPRARW